MTKKEFISMSLPYGLKAEFKEVNKSTSRKKVIGTINAVYDDGTIVCHDTVNSTPSRFKPIVRPLSDLTKECVQANYNNSKPIIPAEILGLTISEINNIMFYKEMSGRMSAFMLRMFIILHFDLIDEDCERLYVTDQFNPYK